jgi:hypothetical protein
MSRRRGRRASSGQERTSVPLSVIGEIVRTAITLAR